MTGGEGDEDDTKQVPSPRARSLVMGVAGLIKDQRKDQHHHRLQQQAASYEGGGRGTSPAGPPPGILRLDPEKTWRSSAASLEFRADKDETSSPCPSDRLSVTWADEDRSASNDRTSPVLKALGSPDRHSVNTRVPDYGSVLEEPSEDEFSTSVSAILQRSKSNYSRGSLTKRKVMRIRSVVATIFGETIIYLRRSAAEVVEEQLKIHKEVLAGVSQHCWPIERKLHLVRNSREYIKKHKGELEQRLTQSTSTNDVLLGYLIKFRRLVRTGIQTVYQWITGLELWQKRIKTIESHFGSAVASYFTFLRWVLGLNVVLVGLLSAFVILPEFLAADRSRAGGRKTLLPREIINAYDFKVMWDFEGIMRYSPLFYGYYSKTPKTREGYRLPLAYFLATLAAYAYSFVAILRKMAANSRMSKLSEHEEYPFTWQLLASWDFTIGNHETAQNKVAAINTGFMEVLHEAKEPEKEEKSWKIKARRLLAHLLVILLITTSVYVVVLLVKRSEDVDDTSSWYRQNELTIILTLITYIYPSLFDLVGLLELRHPKNQLQWQLGRIMALNLLNLSSLLFELFNKVNDMTAELRGLKDNMTQHYGEIPTIPIDPNDFYTHSFANGTASPWPILNETSYATTPDPDNVSYYDFGNESLLHDMNVTFQNYSNLPLLNLVGSTTPTTSMDMVSALSSTLFFITNMTGMPQSGNENSTKSPCKRVPVPCPTVSVEDLTEAQIQENMLTNTSTSDISNFTIDYRESTLLTNDEVVNLETNESWPFYDESKVTIDGNKTVKDENTILIGQYEEEPLPPEIKMFMNGSLPLDEEMHMNGSLNKYNKSEYNTSAMKSTADTIMTSETTQPFTLESMTWNLKPLKNAYNKTFRDLIRIMPGLPSLFGAALHNKTFDLKGNYSDASTGIKKPEYTDDGNSSVLKRKHSTKDNSLVQNGSNDKLRNQYESSGNYRNLRNYIFSLPNISFTEDELKVEGNESLPFSLSYSQENFTSLVPNDSFTLADYAVDNTMYGNDKNSANLTSLSNFIPRKYGDLIWKKGIKFTPKTITKDSSTSGYDINDNTKAQVLTLLSKVPESSNDTIETPLAEDYIFVDEEMGVCYIINCTVFPDETITKEFSSSPLQPTIIETTSSTSIPPTSSVVKTTRPHTSSVFTSSSTSSTTDFISQRIITTTSSFSTTPKVPLSTSSGKVTTPFLVQPMTNNPEKWTHLLPYTTQKRLRKLCWETMFGQEIIKLTIMDLILTVVISVVLDYIRAVVVRFCNRSYHWDLEKQFPGYSEFQIAENILHLVYHQGMIWMGMFFAPGLPMVNILKLLALLYVRSWAVLTSNVPPKEFFKASDNNNFYLMFLLATLFLSTLPVGYAMVLLEPSWHCGPFSDYPKIYQLATSTLIGGLPSALYPVIDCISSISFVIPSGLLLVFIIYYLLSLTAALREANSDLREQLHQHRTANKKKLQEVKSGKGRTETPTKRWGRVLLLTSLDGLGEAEKPSITYR